MKKVPTILGIVVLIAAVTFMRHVKRTEIVATLTPNQALAASSSVADDTASTPNAPPFSIAKCDEWLVRAESSYRFSGDAGMKMAALATACYLSQTVDRK